MAVRESHSPAGIRLRVGCSCPCGWAHSHVHVVCIYWTQKLLIIKTRHWGWEGDGTRRSRVSWGDIVVDGFDQCSFYKCMRHFKGWKLWLLQGSAVQWIRTLALLPEYLCTIPSTHMVVHNCLQLYFRGSNTLFWCPGSVGTQRVHRHTCRQSTQR